MATLLDQTGDLNGQQLYKFLKLYTVPDFVKNASSDAIYGHDELQPHQYADPAKRQFPCHTAAATVISTLFFLDKKAEFSKEKASLLDNRLHQYALFHGINSVIKSLKEKMASYDQNVELTDDSYALVLAPNESGSGKKERYYPLRNALEVNEAAKYLQKNSSSIPYRYRHIIADKILEKAAEYGAGLGDLDEFIHKQAGQGAAASHEVASLLFDRARLLKIAGKIDYAIEVGKLAKTVAGDAESIHDNARLVKLACLIDDVDHASGLWKSVDDLAKPEDVFFNITTKAASALRDDHLSMTTGNIYKLADIDKLKLSDVRDMMGDEFADTVSTGDMFVCPEKLAEIVPTLPRNDADLFDKLLGSVGIKPVIKEASRYGELFDSETLVELATCRK